ncbi:MAG TPA: hypothetical protein VLA19_33030 [Herpetosiphonaceae bacterium]|nr:hypothetical protein [Herpetosiphonaceae bacterium]
MTNDSTRSNGSLPPVVRSESWLTPDYAADICARLRDEFITFTVDEREPVPQVYFHALLPFSFGVADAAFHLYLRDHLPERTRVFTDLADVREAITSGSVRYSVGEICALEMRTLPEGRTDVTHAAGTGQKPRLVEGAYVFLALVVPFVRWLRRVYLLDTCDTMRQTQGEPPRKPGRPLNMNYTHWAAMLDAEPGLTVEKLYMTLQDVLADGEELPSFEAFSKGIQRRRRKP